MFIDLAESLQLEHTFRVVRKTTATRAKQLGADDGTVNMILGDASDGMWRRYTMVIPETVADAVKKVGRYYGLK